MVERVVRTRLSVQVGEYNANMLKAAQATRTVGTEAEKLAQKRQAFEQLGRSMMTAGGLMAAGVGLAIVKFADFDQAMSNVAATGQDARDSLNELREAAIDAGASTVFSATEAANAIEEMAKAGVNAADILSGGLNGALDLAAAGGLDVARAAEITATALNQFGLEGTDAAHVADILAAGAGKAMGSVDDLANGLKFVGPVANAMGVSLEETTGVLAMFAQQGILGEQAGTSLRGVLASLTSPSKQAAGEIERLGLNLYDSQGKFVGLEAVAGQLAEQYRGMDAASRDASMGIIFGRETITAATALYQGGAEAVAQWTSDVNDSGYAAETARTRLDNLKGDVEALGGAFDSAMIKMATGSNGPLRFLVQTLTEVVDGFNDLPDGVQQATFVIGGLTAAAALAGGAFFTAVPKVVDFRTNLAELGPGAQRAGRALGIAAKGLGAITVAATSYALIAQGVEAANEALFSTSDTARNLAAESRTLKESFDQLVHSGAQWEAVSKNSGDVLDRLGDLDNFFTYVTALDETGSAAVGLAKTLQALSPELASMPLEQGQAQFAAYADELGATDAQVLNMLENMPEFKAALLAAADAQGMAKDDASLLKIALGDTPPVISENTDLLRELSGQAESTGEEVEGLADQIRAFGSSVLDTREARRGFEQSFDDLTDKIKENGKTLDVRTQKGRENQSALDDAAQSTYDYAAAVYEETGSQEKANDVISKGRARLIDMLDALGISGQKAEDYADRLGLIPDNISTAVRVQTEAAQRSVNRLIDANNNRRIILNVETRESRVVFNNGNVATSRATGGAIHGPGTGTSDDIPAMLSNGEHVLTAADVAAMGGQGRVYDFRRALHSGDLPEFASGGAVTLKGALDAVSRAESKLRKARNKKKREAAKEELADAREELADVRREFRSEQVDFNRAQRRGENREAGMNGNGLSLVDQLIDIATDVGGKRGERLRKQALTSEKAYLRLEKAADDAAKKVDASASKLDGLKDTVRGWASSVSDAFKRTMDPSQWKGGTRQVAQSRVVDGVTVTSTTTRDVPMTAATIANGSSANAKQIKRVADKLAKLRKMGFNPEYVLKIAQMGVEGEPLVDALLAATSTEMATINRTWTDAGKFADAAGMGIANAQVGAGGKSYEALITAADKQYKADRGDAESTRKKLQTETDRIIKAIGGGLQMGVKKAAGGPITGPGTATSDSIAAWLSNGENVWSAADVQAHGGQSEVERLKRMTPTAPRFAHGGPVGSGWAGRAPVNLTVVNPQVRDLQKDTFESAQILSVAGDL